MYYHSPVGLIKIVISDGCINEIIFLDHEDEMHADEKEKTIDEINIAVFKNCSNQLDEYFSGKRTVFELPLQQTGTPFQQSVWNELEKIPFGKTISYLQLARRIGKVKSIRAVGTANGRNNLSIVVPCHRVIGSDGSLTGYAGCLWRKQFLLEHENKTANGLQLMF
jgi:methylated-DNA-[protein]-cysteine S-methyltransferase